MTITTNVKNILWALIFPYLIYQFLYLPLKLGYYNLYEHIPLEIASIKCFIGILLGDNLGTEGSKYALISNWEGLPILVSDVGGNSECIKDNGYLVKRQDIMDCRKQIKALWDNRENITTLGQNSRKYFEEEFVSQKMLENTLKIYEE